MLIYLLPALVGVRIMATRGRGYLSPAYQAPRLYQYLREHPPETLHTNEPGALWFYLRRYGAGLETPARGPLLVFRVDHPLPPRHQAGVKRPGVRRDKISQMVEDTPLLLYGTEGQVDLYLPTP